MRAQRRMMGSRSIAASAAIALMTTSSLSAGSPPHGCEGPHAPIKAVMQMIAAVAAIERNPALGTPA